MAKTDSPLKQPINDVLIALHLLTRLPLPGAHWSNDARPHARAAWAYPLVGLVVGGISAATAWSALAIGLPAMLAAGFAIAAAIVVTGAMHEDGLADCADGFWGGWEPIRRLEIMKDSQIGTYGVLALILVLGLKWAALTSLLASGQVFWLPVIATVSRASMVIVMEKLQNARKSGLSQSTGRPGSTALFWAVLIGSVTALSTGIATGTALVILSALLTIGMITLSRRKIGGQTGDVLGATQCIVETSLLVVLCALVP
ncbi:MAG: adenosylcobinamide-GDP ribazoletransferase [Litoreibacter sp.]|nr:adenosylcobinamide-GDP ribazoletransferase [Litoreibacter sp.]